MAEAKRTEKAAKRTQREAAATAAAAHADVTESSEDEDEDDDGTVGDCAGHDFRAKEKKTKKKQKSDPLEIPDPDEPTEHTPEERVRMQREVAAQKAEKEA